MICGSYVDNTQIIELRLSSAGLYNGNSGYSDTVGKTVRATTINTAVKNAVLILAGQSNFGTSSPTSYTPTNSTKVDNFNIYDCQTYAAAGVLLGSTWSYQALGGTVSGHVGGRIADALINAGKFDRVILVPVAVGGTTVANWDIAGPLYGRIEAAIRRLRMAGVTPDMTNVTFAVLWGQGEGDSGTSQAAYDASMRRIIDKTRAAGFSGRFLIAKQTLLSGSQTSTVRAAQAAVVGHDAQVYAGPDADTLTGANRQADGTHFSDAGAAAYASAWVTALAATGAPF